MSFLGLDFGASFVKAGVLDGVTGTVRSVERVPFPRFLEVPPGQREVDPSAITKIFHQLLDKMITIEPEPEGLVLCSQMHGFVFTNDRGKALSNFVSWQDQRAEEIDPATGHTYYEEMRSWLGEKDIVELGGEVRSGLPASQLFRLVRTDQLPTGACACSLGDFLVAEACGQRPTCEPTMASAHGLFDLFRGDWHGSVLTKLELPAGLLPNLVPTGSRVGIMRWRGRDIPCYTPVGDQQCALTGVFLQENELSLNIATGSQASRRTSGWEPGEFQVRPYFQGEFLRTITHIPAGRSLNALIGLFSELSPKENVETTWERVLEKVEKIESTNAQVDLSFFPGAFGDSGALTHLHEGNLTVGSLFLAALEGMVSNYRRAAQRLDPEATAERLVLSGGLAQNIPRLRTLIQEKIPLAHRLPLDREDTLQGLLALSLLWSGQTKAWADLQEKTLGNQTEA